MMRVKIELSVGSSIIPLVHGANVRAALVAVHIPNPKDVIVRRGSKTAPGLNEKTVLNDGDVLYIEFV